LEAQELLEISNEVDHETVQQALKQAISSLDDEERNWIRDARHYEEDQIGHMMNMDKVTVLQHLKVSDVVDHLQNLDELPEQTDKIFIVTRTQRLMGEVTLIELLRNRGEKDIAAVMEEEAITFLDTDTVEEAIIAFEHYDLVSAAVVNHRGRLVGRLTVESVMDVTMERADEKVLAREGLSADSDLFGPVLEAARQRWAWLAVNLITAFTASRFISLFEDTIAELVALATLMPIVASIGGNTGNQTITLFTRGLVLDQIRSNNLRYLIQKELTVSLLNGCLWGGVLGCASGLLYQNLGLGVVLATATLLNLVLAAGFGMWVPLTLDKLGKDPALGSSVVLTFCTDSLGFLIFLGLASAFLVP
jgi:magnesium transporter